MGKIKGGFTLIELLVVIGVVATVGTIVANLFFANLRAAAKTKALTEVKQNGDYALSVMERMIRNAKKIQLNTSGKTCESGMSNLKILNSDGGTTEFICDAVNEQIASNSAFLTSDKLTLSTLSTCSFSCDQPAGKPAVIDISFTLEKGNVSLGREFTAEASFHATVSARLY